MKYRKYTHFRQRSICRWHQTIHVLPSPAATVSVTLPQDAELQAALDRARLAEHREEAHQMRWAGEIHALREQVQGLKNASHRLRVMEGEVLDRSR